MEDEKDIQPPANPAIQVSETGKEPTEKPLMINSAKLDDSTASNSSVPLYEDLQAVPAPGATARETAIIYSNYLQSAPGFPWQPTEESMSATPTFAAPYLTHNESGIVTQEQLITGIFINVPRSPKLWAGDQLKMRWGYNTYYTTIGESTNRSEPRLTQYLNCERLGDYKNGEVEVRYEVVRRSRLVGVSETLKLIVCDEGKGRPKPTSRKRSIRRRKLYL